MGMKYRICLFAEMTILTLLCSILVGSEVSEN